MPKENAVPYLRYSRKENLNLSELKAERALTNFSAFKSSRSIVPVSLS